MLVDASLREGMVAPYDAGSSTTLLGIGFKELLSALGLRKERVHQVVISVTFSEEEIKAIKEHQLENYSVFSHNRVRTKFAIEHHLWIGFPPVTVAALMNGPVVLNFQSEGDYSSLAKAQACMKNIPQNLQELKEKFTAPFILPPAPEPVPNTQRFEL